MTEEELREIEARALAAMEGKLRALPCGDYESDVWAVYVEGNPFRDVLEISDAVSSANAELFAHARADILALVEEVRQLQAGHGYIERIERPDALREVREWRDAP